MSGDEVAPEGLRTFSAKMPLRTYSRRAVKRRFTSPPRSVEYKMSRRTQSFTATAPESNDRTKRPREQQTPNSGRKRVRLSAPAMGDKRTTELFLEHLGSSSIMARRSQRQDDQLEEVVLLQTGEDQIIAADDASANEEPKAVVKADESDLQSFEQHERATVEEIKPEDESSEDSDDQDGSLDAGADFEDIALTTSFKPSARRYTLLSLSPPSDQKPQAKDRFLTAAKPPPSAAFKHIQSVQTRLGTMDPGHVQKHAGNPFKVTKLTGDGPAKAGKHISDGFTSDEAQPSPYRKRERRTKRTLSETQLKHLELTQKGAATQKLDGPTWPRGQKRARPAHVASLWGRRQYFGSSQFQIESQDPLESFEIEEPMAQPCFSRDRSKRLVNQICDDADEPHDFLKHHDGPDEQNIPADAIGYVDDPNVAKKLNERLQRSFSPDELVDLLEVSDEEEELDLVTISRTDRPEPHMKDASSESRFGPWKDSDLNSQLPPKRMLSIQADDRDGLTLRPDSREWLRGVERVSETPPRKDATSPQSSSAVRQFSRQGRVEA